jgi:alpha-L-rhamnosidase
MYSTVAGIDLDPSRPGYKHAIIRPEPPQRHQADKKGRDPFMTADGKGSRPFLTEQGLTHARAALETLYGRIESAWRVEGSTLKLNVTIPPNTTATLRLPTKAPKSITEGGRAAGQAKGVKASTAEGELAILELEAGHYEFSAEI